jgi:hypothetical protein
LLVQASDPESGPESAGPITGRVLAHANGLRLSPYADLPNSNRVTGLAAAGPVRPSLDRRFWHRSPGSAG